MSVDTQNTKAKQPSEGRAIGILVILALLTCLGSLEVGLRIWQGHTTEEPMFQVRAGASLMESVPQILGWAPRPNYIGARTTPNGDDFILRTNRHRMRGADVSNTPLSGSRRILFLGDSFTMGSMYPEEETFVGHVRRILDQQASQPVEVINAGVDGYGTYLELAYYKLHARKLRPHIVVLCLYAGNDFRDNMVATAYGTSVNPLLFARPNDFLDPDAAPRRLLDENGEWLPDPISGEAVARPDSPWSTSLQRRSLLARLFGSRLRRLLGRWQDDLSSIDMQNLYHFFEIGFFQHRQDAPFRTAWDLTLGCIDELRHATLEDGAELLLVVLPSDLQLIDARYQETLAMLDVAEAGLGPVDRMYVNRCLVRYSADRDLAYLNLVETFEAEPRPDQLYHSYMSNDRHLSAEGHRVTGKAISTFILEQSSHIMDSAIDAHERALAWIAAGDIISAEEDLRASIRLNPGRTAAYRALGDLLRSQEQFEAARAIYRQGIEMDPESATLFGASGDMSLALGDSVAALEQYRTAVEFYPSDLVMLERLLHLGMEPAGREQIPHQLKVVAELPDPTDESQLNVREMYARKFHNAGLEVGNLELSMCYLRLAAGEYGFLLKFLPDDKNLLTNLANAYYDLAYALAQKTNHEAAAEYFRLASELRP